MRYGQDLQAWWQRRSIQQVTLVAALVVFTGLYGVEGWWSYQAASHELQRRQDQALLLWAQQRAESAAGVLEPSALQLAGVWSVLDGQFHPVRGASDLPLPGGLPSSGGTSQALAVFGDVSYRGELARALVVPTRTGGYVHALQWYRDRAVEQGALLQAQVVTGAVKWLVSWLLVSVLLWWAFRPVVTLREELVPLEGGEFNRLAGVYPAELQPLVHRLNRLIEEQRGRVERERKFLADAAHQLRTPLAVLKVQAQGLMARELPPEDTYGKMLSTINRSSQLVNQLLAQAKVTQQTHQAPVLQPVEIAAVASEVAQAFAPLMARKQLNFSLDAQPLVVLADAWLLGELLRNLLSNAIHHSPAGDALGIVIRKLGPEVEVIVWDHGGGVSDATRVRLFEPFAAARGGTGVGLGLVICKQIVESMGGRIDLFNRHVDHLVVGCDAVVRWPGADASTSAGGGHDPR